MRCNDLPLPASRTGACAAQAGFTLLELLLTMVVMGVLLAIAVPSFQSLVQSQHDSDITNQFAQDLAWAQGEALSGQAVVLTLNADGSWSVTEDTYDSSSNSIKTTAFPGHSLSSTQLQADAPGVSCALVGGSTTSCAATLTFNSIGTVSGAPVGVIQYKTGTTSSSFQVFASGTLVPNPSYAS